MPCPISQFKNMSELGLEGLTVTPNFIMRWGRGRSAGIRSLDRYWLYVELILSFISLRNIFPEPLAKGEIIDYI